MGTYNIHEAVGVQTVCVTLSGDLDGTNVSISMSSSSDEATAQGITLNSIPII